MIPIAGRFKDALWSIRHRYGLETDIDRIIPFIVFERTLTEVQLNDLFITYPKQTPEDFKMALITRIRQATRQYWSYRQTHKGYHKVLREVIFLENIVRHGFEGCKLVHNEITGFELELKEKK